MSADDEVTVLTVPSAADKNSAAPLAQPPVASPPESFSASLSGSPPTSPAESPVESPVTDTLTAEQQAIDFAYSCLDAMREKTTRAVEQAKRDAHLTDAPDAAAIQARLLERLAAVAESSAPLTFGRIDEEPFHGVPGPRYYIGRRHVEGPQLEPIVIDWRAPAAAPFYRATWADPMGLVCRSRFALNGRVLAGTFDEDFTSEDGAAAGTGGVPDPLLAELNRARTGSMRDIVATIQAEQDAVIRAPMADLIVVQGGPGTGKTAVGLHRAAFLLYAHRNEFERRKLLVVGPNRLFLAYIGQVLPSLGETSAMQATIETLMARFVVRAVESDDLRRLKGDVRMAEVIRRLAMLRVMAGDATADLDVMTPFGGATLPGADAAAIINEVLTRQLPVLTARTVAREQIVAEAWRQRLRRTGDPEQQFVFVDSLRKSSGLKAYFDRLWPVQSALSIVKYLYANGSALAAASEGLLSPAERKMLKRAPQKKATDEKWTRADLSLLDEANHLLVGDTPLYAHVVIDEAQDLSAMELRLVGRRSADRSLTVLGDLAQATTPGSQTSWEVALNHLGHGKADARGNEQQPASGRVEVLELGYRVPEEILDFANLLLPIAAPLVQPSRSVRQGGAAPHQVRVKAHELLSTVVQQARTLNSEFGLVGVLAPAAMLDEVVDAFTNQSVSLRDVRRHAVLEDGISLVAAEASKGLEFDATVVIEPAAIINASLGDIGYRVLYVSLTRATQRVVIVHSDDLPEELASANPAGVDALAMV